MMENLDISYLLGRVGVQPPYFALKDLQLDKDKGAMSAQVPVEQYSEMECSPITAAESGRHLAILGCCLLAAMNKEEGKFYYLASSAIYKSYRLSNEIDTSQLVGYVSGDFCKDKKREATAKAQLKTVNQELLCDLDLSYHVFPERIFERLFSKHKHALTESPKGFNPYANIPGFAALETSNGDKTLHASLAKLSPENCLGHFPMYPAIPIAIMSHYLISASGHLLKTITSIDNLQYYVEEVNLSAPHLGFFNENVELKIDFVKKEDESYTFSGVANADMNKCVGEMTIVLKVLN